MIESEKTPKEIFLEALELPAEGRHAFVESVCEGKTRERVFALLETHEEADRWLGDEGSWSGGESSVPASAAFEADDEVRADTTIGAYRLREEIGIGGFGSVWAADQEGTLRRRVAVKVLKLGLDTREVVARFEAERQALALMDHPCIARVFDGGTTRRGRPWFAMELVDGIPITEYCEKKSLSTQARLELFLDVCRAVQHAHQKAIVHRDLKPNNVLVTEVDGRPVPKVIDFGIAKALDARLADQTAFTLDGQIVGTPAYMSPEQVGDSTDIDTRADVYSLGALLYELLSGHTPFHETSLQRAGLAEAMRVILEEDPPRPSTRLSGVRTTHVRRRQVAGDLDWIVMRCLEKERERRYDSASVLGNEIERHLRGEPVLAGPPDFGYRVRKFARRYRTALVVTVGMFVLLAGGVLVSADQAQRAIRAEQDAAAEAVRANDEAERARAAAELATLELTRSRAIADYLERLLLSIDPAVARTKDRELLAQILGEAAAALEGEDGKSPHPPEVEATLRRIVGFTYYTLGLHRAAEPHLVRTLELREESLPAEDALVLDASQELAAVYAETGRVAEALPLFERVWVARRSLPADSPERLTAQANLGIAHRRLGNFAEAEEHLLAVEAARAELFGEDDPDTALSISAVAGLLWDLGRRDEAVERYELALEIQWEALGEDHPHTLKAMNNVAHAYEAVGRFEESAELLTEALAIKRTILPPGNPSLLRGMNNLAHAWLIQGKEAAAEELYREALRDARTALGLRNETTIGLAYNLGNQLLKRGQLVEAEALLSEANEAAPGVLPEGHPLFESLVPGLAEARRRLGR